MDAKQTYVRFNDRGTNELHFHYAIYYFIEVYIKLDFLRLQYFSYVSY